jgi:peptidoglycan/LPS O-acetylase OafA/YrhL
VRIVGFDAIRLVCAAVVALGHFPFQVTAELTPLMGAPAAHVCNALLANAFNGPAAVVVFFVLSGFVIHLPYANGRPFSLTEFAARRYVRILPPVLVFIGISWVLGRPLGDWDWNNTILWSVICELVYYTMYPLLRWSRVPFEIWAAASCAGVLMCVLIGWPVALRPGGDFLAFGYWTFLVGLPAWLLGCVLARHRGAFPVLGVAAMWTMRAAVFTISVLLKVLKFHGEPYIGVMSSNVVLLSAFTVPIVVWLGFESRYYTVRPDGAVVSRLDRAGTASFSLYLVHSLVLGALAMVLPVGDLPSLLLYLSGTAVATVLFYLAVERPSHHLARTLGHAVRRPPQLMQVQ